MNRTMNGKLNRTSHGTFSFFHPTHKVPQALLLAALVALAAGGCKSNSTAPIINNGNVADAGPGPADGNLAPVAGQPTEVLGQTSSYAPQQSGESYSQYPDQQQAQQQDQEQAGADALAQADQPPPPLPDYEQPPAPDPNYLWTPGYWAYGSGGYYWVPGAWCPPPYYGALWTPPYWAYDGGHYRFHSGYWGPHIGYYGGVDYGFGYIGIGFFGGYWRGHDFYYNRSVTNVGHVTNVYNREVVYNNVHYGAQPANRVSYNGGRGGLNARPQPAELAATREYHTPPVAVQSQDRQAAAQNRQQFYAANHGRPAQATLARPAVANARIAEPPAPAAAQIQHANEAQQHAAQPQQRNAPAQPQEQQRNAQPEQRSPQVQQQQQQRAVQPQEPQRTMQSQQQRQQENRPAPATEARPAPQPHAEAAPRAVEQRPVPEARPAPAPRPTPEAHPAPAPRAAAPHAEAPHEAPKEAPKEEGHPR